MAEGYTGIKAGHPLVVARLGSRQGEPAVEPAAVCKPRHRGGGNHAALRSPGQRGEQHTLSVRQVDGDAALHTGAVQGQRHRAGHGHRHRLAFRRAVGAVGGERLQGAVRRHHVHRQESRASGTFRSRKRPQVRPPAEGHALSPGDRQQSAVAKGHRRDILRRRRPADVEGPEGHEEARPVAGYGRLHPLWRDEGEACRPRWRRLGDRPLRPQGGGQLSKAHRASLRAHRHPLPSYLLQ